MRGQDNDVLGDFAGGAFVFRGLCAADSADSRHHGQVVG